MAIRCCRLAICFSKLASPNFIMGHIRLIAACLFSVSLTCQNPGSAVVQLEFDVAPPSDELDLSAGNWIPAPGPNDPPLDMPASRAIRMKLIGPPGAHVRPCVDFAIDPLNESEFESLGWLQRTSVPASSLQIHGAVLGSPNVEVHHHLGIQRWISQALLNNNSTLQVDGVRPWAQPLLTPHNGVSDAERLWVANAPMWGQTPQGQLHAMIWMAQLNFDSQATFDAMTMLRMALVEQSLFVTGSTTAAKNLFQSPLWGQALTNGWLRLGIQVLSASANNFVVTGPWETDPQVPDLSGGDPEYVMPPLVRLTARTKMIIRPPLEHSDGTVAGLSGATLVPGSRHYFVNPSGRSPVNIGLSMSTGQIEYVTAYAWPTMVSPAQYVMFVPHNFVSGPVYIKQGAMTAGVQVGVVSKSAQLNQ
jgi:hypothetical protein